MKDDRLYLIHIWECILHVEQDTSAGREAFFADRKTRDAVLRNLQTLAESAIRLSDAVKARRSDVDWRAIGAFRNVLVHDYLGIDPHRIWLILERDIPSLKAAVETLLCETGGVPPSA